MHNVTTSWCLSFHAVFKSDTPNSGAIIGGAVALVLIVTVAVTTIIITVLFLKGKQSKETQPQ